MTLSADWKNVAHAINGQQGSHYDLAQWVEGKGFEVQPDPDNNQRSILARPGPEDFGVREIVGDAEAVVRLTASLE